MSWNTAATPTGWVHVVSARHSNLFLEGDSLDFTLSATTAVAYEIRDYYGTIVRSGIPSGTTLHIAALPLGWYKLFLHQAGSDATYGSVIGTCMFSVMRADSRLVAPPTPSGQGGAVLAFAGQDHITRGIGVLGPYRNSLDIAEDPTNGMYGQNISRIQDDRVFQRNWYESHPDTARPRPAFLAFPNGTTGAGQPAGVTQTVTAMYPDIQYFEGPINEPDPNNPATATGMQTFKAAVKAGNASAKVMGPSTVSVNGGIINGIEAFIAAGGLTGVDAFAFHFYNCANGDIPLGRRSMDGLMTVLAAHGLSGIEKWQTEWGQFGATYGVYNTRRQARWAMLHRFLLDQYGVPKERDSWFYDSSHGFWDFPSMWKTRPFDGSERGDVMPMLTMYRVFSQEVFGKQWAARLDFGTVLNNMMIGSRYENASDGSAVLTFLSDSRTDAVAQLHVTGASSLDLVNPFGTVQTVSADSQGIVTVPVAMEPVYARVPAGVTATVVQASYGADLARTATGVGAGASPAKPLSGVLGSYYWRGDSAEAEYYGADGLPATFTAVWDGPTEGDTIVVRCPTPWQQQSSFLDFDVSWQDAGGAWHLIETITVDPATIQSATPEEQGGCFYETYHSGRCTFVIEMPRRVAAKALRLDVRDATAGGEATHAANAAGGQGWEPKKITLRELSFYSRQPRRKRLRSFSGRVV